MNNINIFSMQEISNLFWVGIGLTFLFGIILIFFLLRKKNVAAMGLSFIFGLLVMGMFILSSYFGNGNTPTSNIDVLNKTKYWYGLISNIFITLITIMLPIFIFSVVVNFILGDHMKKIRGKTYLVSFLSLLMLSFVGIAIAILISPILYSLPQEWFIDNISNGSGGEDGGGVLTYFTKWWVIIIIIFTAIYSSFGILLATKNNSSKRERYSMFFNIIMKYVSYYFKIVILLVPFVILTRISAIGLSDIETTNNNLALMISYMGIWWLGAIIILFLLIAGNMILSKSEISSKEKAKSIMEQILVSFSTQSTQVSLAQTQKTARDFGVSKEISQLTPTKGTIMGMIMCNGFSPMLIIMFTLINAGHGTIDWSLVFWAVLIVSGLTISTSGQGSTDYVILITVFGALGISSDLYLSVLMPVQEINERGLRTPNNTLGHIFATQITDKYHRKTTKSKNK